MTYSDFSPAPLRARFAVIVLALGLGLSACQSPEPAVTSPPEGAASAASGGASPQSIEDGYIAVGGSSSPFDTDLPPIARLDADLQSALQAAATAAGSDGIDMVVTSGWRSAEYQQSLLDAAVSKYGSLDEARRWVNTPEKSTHVTGDAVDIGDTDADSWLSQHGADYGLCQTYANEMWHFELAIGPGQICPVPRQDAAG